jgi:hypothetical protein
MDPQDKRRRGNTVPLLSDEYLDGSLQVQDLGDNSPEGLVQNVSSADHTDTGKNPCLVHRKNVANDRPLMKIKRPTHVESSEKRRPVARLPRVPRNSRFLKTSPIKPNIFKNWWLEIGACFLFIISIGAVVVTLYPHQGKPLPKWPYRLSVNAVISIYVVILKSSILLVAAEGLGQLKWNWLERSRPLQDLVHFDNATRGPLGAVGLLWRLRARHLSSIGALISLLVLGLDPFMQQVIRYLDCKVPVDGINGKIPRTNVYQITDT